MAAAVSTFGPARRLIPFFTGAKTAQTCYHCCTAALKEIQMLVITGVFENERFADNLRLLAVLHVY